MELIAIKENIEDNKVFTDDPDCKDSIYMSVEYFKKIGYNIPWIGYYAKLNGQLVGCAAFKGKPVNGRVEIAYGVFPKYMHKGIGTTIAATLVQLSLKTDPSAIITAKTLPEENYSTRVLRKNNFKLLGQIFDEEDGDLWDWEYHGESSLKSSPLEQVR
jgi:ribosomal-protein-alanine N-acetyltransferase